MTRPGTGHGPREAQAGATISVLRVVRVGGKFATLAGKTAII